MSNLQCNLDSGICVVLVIIFFITVFSICCWLCNFIYPFCKLNNKYKEHRTNQLEYEDG